MLLIKNGLVRMQDAGAVRYDKTDILVEHGRMIRIEPHILRQPGMEVCDASGKLIVPGLINAHIHSHDNFNRGWLDNMPLELWMAKVRPFYSGVRHTPRQVYYRTLLGAAEMLKTGTTSVMDDVLLNSATDEKSLEAVIKAYEDIGMRAVVLPHIKNKNLEDTIPYAKELFSCEMRRAAAMHCPPEEEIAAFMEEKIRKYCAKGRRVTVGLSFSAVQRSTEKLMREFQALSVRYDVPVACHMLETYVQKQTGLIFYGKSLVEHMHDLELLNENMVLIHCNWVTPQDVERMAEHHCCAVHNPACNLKMGSGIAPVSALLRSIPVGLGTDNISANDCANLFEAMKLGALLSKIRTPEFTHWLSAAQAMDMATAWGSRCLRQETAIGSIQVGKQADLTLLDMRNEHYIMADDYDKALVYGENGSAVDTVFVSGEAVVKNGRLAKVDEDELFSVLGEMRRDICREHRTAEKESTEAVGVFEQCYRRCNEPLLQGRETCLTY